MHKLIIQLKSDESLMRAYQRGDSSAFDALYQRHKDKLFNFIYRSYQQSQAVEDIAHETWMAVIRNIENYRPTAKFTTYLYQIARSKVIDHWRKNKDLTHKQAEQGQFESEIQMQHHSVNNVEQLQLVSELMYALSELPHEQREAFLLKEEGFSQREIADITDCKPETVKSRIRYARQQLRELTGVPA